jgi:type VI secretion system protein ImpK
MSERRPLSLLDCFAAYYAELAGEKRTVDERNAAPTLDPAALASEASNRLLAFLERQQQAVRATGTTAEIAFYGHLRQVMAALADEAFLLDLRWAGRRAWLGVLLEERLCGSRNAGSQFFEYANHLLRADDRGVASRDASSVLLLALGLGFQGCYRGAEGQRILAGYRRKLYRLAGDGTAVAPPARVFEQAYRYCAVLPEQRPGASLRPAVRAACAILAGYLLLSLLLWLWTVAPFVDRAGGVPSLSA